MSRHGGHLNRRDKGTPGGAAAAGSYLVSGTDSDGYGDIGTWTYTLTVTGTENFAKLAHRQRFFGDACWDRKLV